MRKHIRLLVILLVLAVLLPATGSPMFNISAASLAVAPTLGAAESFAVLGGETVTNTGPTVINANLGVWPGSAVTGFPPGVVVAPGVIHAGDAVAAQAQNDVTTAYNALAGQACDVNLTGQDLGGLTLAPGVYCFDTSAQLTGQLSLNVQGDSNAVFVFKIGSTLTTASNASVVFVNGGPSCNVFWQIGSSATLGTDSGLAGNVLALASATLNTGASVTGRVLARNGAVTLDTNTVTLCVAAPAATNTPIPVPTNTPVPVPTNTPVPVPTNTPVPVPTNTPVPVPTNTPVPVPTNTPVPVPTNTPVPVPTNTPVPVPTNTPVPVPTNTPIPVPTNTPVPVPTNTPVPVPTNTPVPAPTNAPTNTPVPVATNTPVPVPTNTPVPVPTNTPFPVPTNTPVPVPTNLPTNTPVPVPTNTPVPVPTNTPVPVPTNTPVPVPTNTPVPVPTNTPVPILPTSTPPPSAVELLYFVAGRNGPTVVLHWATEQEIDNYGFNLYRAPAGNFAQAELIHFEPSAIQGGTGSGAIYSYLDTPSLSGRWWYWLADVDTRGVETLYNPSVATAMQTQFQVYLPWTGK